MDILYEKLPHISVFLYMQLIFESKYVKFYKHD